MDIKALREKCQSSRAARDTWYGLKFARRVSIYITVLFLRLGISATGATAVFMASGLLSALIFSLGGRANFLAGALALQLFYVLDHVDGEVARYREDTSLTGKYFDELIHYVVHALVFFGIGWGVFRMTGNTAHIAAGVFAGLSVMMVNLIIDLGNLMLLRNFHRGGEIGGSQEKGNVRAGNAASAESGAGTIVSRIYVLCSFPVIMNLITVSAAVDLLFKRSTMTAVLWFYAVLLSVTWITRAAVFISGRRIDENWRKGRFK